MKITSLLRSLAVFPLAFVLFVFYTSGPPAGYTGSPGDGRSCTACHSNSGNFSPSVNLTHDIPAEGYVPGQTYNLTLSISSSASKHGFQMTAEDGNHAKTGTFRSAGSDTQAASGGQYIEHTSGGTSSSSWTFQWIAPSDGAGTVTFYAALNAANADNNTTGDRIVLFDQAVQQTAVRPQHLAGIRVFPNPVEKYLYFDIRSGGNPDVIRLLDASGKILRIFSEFSGGLDMRSYPAGIYYVEIYRSGKKGMYRIVKK